MRNRIVAAVAGALVALVALAGCTPAPEEKTYTPEQQAELLERYTFTERLFECETDEYGMAPLVAYAHSNYGPSAPGDGPKREDSDSVDLRLTGETVDDKYRTWHNNMCTSTSLALLWGHVLGNIEVNGARVFDIDANEALRLADVPLEEINDLADSFLLKEGGDLEEYRTSYAVYKNYVEVLVSILHNFEVLGEDALTSSKNWHLVPLPSAGIGEFEVNPDQESLPALLIGITLKGMCEPAQLMGVNLSDQRPEFFELDSLNDKLCEDTPPGDTPGPTPTPTPECVDCKGEVPENGWTPLGPEGPASPTPSPSPSIPLDPEAEPGSDTGSDVPVVDATPNPPPSGPPAVEVPQAPEPEDPGTSIGGPPAD